MRLRLPRLRTIEERLADEETRTGYKAQIWWSQGRMMWMCRIEGMAGFWLAHTKQEATRIVYREMRWVPSGEGHQ